jgi:Abnormal spindle-like microcephaly-assoc'd, ASPM-SPD-2-Hydin
VLGHSETQIVVVTNSGSNNATISSIAVSSSDFKVSDPKLPVVLPPGGSLALAVTFTPSSTGFNLERITLMDKSTRRSWRFPMGGAGLKSESLIATPSTLSFGQVIVGKQAELPVVLKNDRTWNVTVMDFYTMSSGFSVKGPALPITVAPGGSVRLTVTFAPQSVGLEGSSVFISPASLSVPLAGTGITSTPGKLTVAPSTLNFGSVDVGSSTKQTLTLSASNKSVTVSSATSSNSQFTIPGATFPMTIDASETASLYVVFSPTGSGTSSGKLTFVSNASDRLDTEPLTGSGVVPEYSVALSWNASTSAVAGYNVYRGTAVGKYSKINTTLDPNTAYTDNAAVSGTTYYYAATAVNSKGEESAYSAPLKVLIP